MMKRAVWFMSGAVVGVTATSYAKKKVKETAQQLAPTNVAKVTVAKVRQRGHDVIDAVREGREAKQAKEIELRARLEPIAPGQVIVLREVRDNEQVGPRRSSRRPRRGT
mgnify:CR=1 FL=1